MVHLLSFCPSNKQVKRENVYFGSHFQRFQFGISWLHGFGLVGEAKPHGAGADSGRWKGINERQRRKKIEEKEWMGRRRRHPGRRHTIQRHSPGDYFSQPGPNQEHFPPLFINGIKLSNSSLDWVQAESVSSQWLDPLAVDHACHKWCFLWTLHTPVTTGDDSSDVIWKALCSFWSSVGLIS